MKKTYRIIFTHQNDAKTRVDLGMTLGKYKVEGIGWTRAYQLIQKDTQGNFPYGKITFEEMKK
jgi:hypothetical protein